MESGLLALLLSLVLTPIYTIILAVVFYRCLKQNPFDKRNQKRQEVKAQEQAKPSKGDLADFAEAKVMKPIAVNEPQEEDKEEEEEAERKDSSEQEDDEEEDDDNLEDVSERKERKSSVYKAAPVVEGVAVVKI